MLPLKENEPLAIHSTYKVGGAARWAVTVDNAEDLVAAIQFAQEKNIPWRVLGGGSNFLAPDAGYAGLIIWYTDRALNISVESGVVEVGAGATTAYVAGQTASVGLTGLEWAAGVPGTIGGAIFGNAGAAGGETKDVVQKVLVWEKGITREYDRTACVFGYRHSRFKKNYAVILRGWLQLARALDPEIPQEKIKEVLAYRANTQPKGLSSAGCVFKNYEPSAGSPRLSAGKLIDDAGLKGTTIGGAQISEAHGNFIVNTGTATATDILALIDLVKKTVLGKFGILLEEEITILRD